MLERGWEEAENEGGRSETCLILLENTRRTLPLRRGYLISDLLRKQASMLTHAKRPHEALNKAIYALEASPTYAYAWKALGDVYRSLRRFWEARACYDIAIHLDPSMVKDMSLLLLALDRILQGALSDANLLERNLITA
ncbi:transmembrane protein, partial [Cystoisospora suis]